MCSIASTPLTASSKAPSYLIHHSYVPRVIHSCGLPYAHLCHIFDDHYLMPITVRIEQFPEVSCFLLRSDSPTDRVSLLQKSAHYPSGDIAICARDEDLAGGLHSRHDMKAIWRRELVWLPYAIGWQRYHPLSGLWRGPVPLLN